MSPARIAADLHIHTCLSPCSDLEMSPIGIVEHALRSDLQIIAISDHNSAENAGAVMEAARGTSLVVIPAMEITSREEAHILALFPDLDTALSMQSELYAHMPESDDEKYYMDQVIASAQDEVDGFCRRLLISATPFPVRKIVEMIHAFGGAAVAAHIDRMAFGIISQLGFIPPQIHFDALEISRHVRFDQVSTRFPEYAHIPFITGSDAHFLKDIGEVRTHFVLENPGFESIMKAFRKELGYRVDEQT